MKWHIYKYGSLWAVWFGEDICARFPTFEQARLYVSNEIGGA
jgi:hypothetical protein